MNLRILSVTFVMAAVSSTAIYADTIGLTWKYNPPTAQRIYQADGITPLSGAGTAANGDGFALQLGYYSMSTTSNPFNGTWIPVFGENTSTSLFSVATMGDNTAKTGTDVRFLFSGTIDTAIPGTIAGLPAAGTIMAIKYYDANLITNMLAYGAASNSSWLWISPSAIPPPGGMMFNMKDPGMVYAGGVSVPMVNVPEPAAAALLLMGGGALLTLRRRRG